MGCVAACQKQVLLKALEAFPVYYLVLALGLLVLACVVCAELVQAGVEGRIMTRLSCGLAILASVVGFRFCGDQVFLGKAF